MGTWFIGIDYGTVHTKVCVRGQEDVWPSPVEHDPDGEGIGRFLIPSARPGWAAKEPPKILLCGRDQLDPQNECAAMHEAVEAVALAVRAAIRHVVAVDGPGCKFILQLGLPTEDGVMVDAARQRYLLVVEAALGRIGDARVKPSATLLDERLASLALLDRAKMELSSEALLVIDGGGWTTHLSSLRWSLATGEASVTIEGDHTATIGVHAVVRELAGRMRLRDGDAAAVMDGVMRAVYARARDGRIVLDDGADIVARYARAGNLDTELARTRVSAVTSALGRFTGAPGLKEGWSAVWKSTYSRARSSAHFKKYRLILAGGAARIGRDVSTMATDPLAQQLTAWQAATTIPFTDIIYPELDQRFWTFEPAPPEEVIPYLFVAGGYTIPYLDWPAALKRREVLKMEPRAEFRLCHCSGLSDSCGCGGTGFIWTGGARRSDSAPSPGRDRGSTVTRHSDVYICELCDDVMPSFGSMAHRNSHECSECRELVRDTKEHKIAVHGWARCAICGAVTKKLASHRAKHHPAPPPVSPSAAPQGPAQHRAASALRPPAAPKPARPSAPAAAPSRSVRVERRSESAPVWPPPGTQPLSAKRSGGTRGGGRKATLSGEPLKHNPFAKLKQKKGEEA